MSTQDTGRPERYELLAGRVALVTGSARNIGKAIAVAFARHGARVVVNGHRDADALQRTVAEIEAAGGEAIAVLSDVSDHVAVERMVKQVQDTFGSLDIVVSNVAVRKHQPFLDISIEDWHRTLETNLSATFYLDRAALPGMVERGFGRLIHISGLDGFTGHYPDRAHNVVAKIGVAALAKAIAREFGRHGITANTVAPGAIDTERDWSQYKHFKPEEVVKDIAIGRLGTTAEIAAACLYLASEGAAFVTGQTLHLNGGQYMF